MAKPGNERAGLVDAGMQSRMIGTVVRHEISASSAVHEWLPFNAKRDHNTKRTDSAIISNHLKLVRSHSRH